METHQVKRLIPRRGQHVVFPHGTVLADDVAMTREDKGQIPALAKSVEDVEEGRACGFVDLQKGYVTFFFWMTLSFGGTRQALSHGDIVDERCVLNGHRSKAWHNGVG